jgi:flagellar biosynthetic protein FlhB
MAEDRENATEEPSDKRVSEAHGKGQFAQAPEIQLVAGLVAGALALLAVVPAVSTKMLVFSSQVLGHLDEFQVTSEAVAGAITVGFSSIALVLLPLLLSCMLAAMLAGGLQSGFKLTTQVFENGAEKLDIAQGIQRVFSASALMKMGVDFIKLLIVGTLVYISLQEILSDPIFYTPVPPSRLGEFIFHSAMSLIFRLAMAMSALALLHFLYQKAKVHKGMKMTHQEVKDEAKQAQGDPMVKSAMRAMARRLMVKQMLGAIPTADVVIVNPTHFAVALKYERGVDSAPMVLAKGRNLFALRIKQLAQENGVPMVENRPVAQTLYKIGEVGKTIPPELYQAVAEILGFVYRTQRYYFHKLKERRLRSPSPVPTPLP